MTSLGFSSTSDVITFDQNCHNLYLTSAGEKDLSNDAQIRVIGLMEPEISTKMLKKMSEKLRAKLPPTTPGCAMVKIGRLNDTFLEVFFFNSKQAQEKVNHSSEKKRKGKKGKGKKIEKPKDVGHLKILISVHA